jgi:hypothetical protein
MDSLETAGEDSGKKKKKIQGRFDLIPHWHLIPWNGMEWNGMEWLSLKQGTGESRKFICPESGFPVFQIKIEMS